MENQEIRLFEDRQLTMAKLQLEIIEAEKNLKQSPEYLKLEELKKQYEEEEKRQEEFKEKIKLNMENTNVKKIQISEYTFTLKESAGALKVEDETIISDVYFDTKKVLNKTRLKEDVKNGIVVYPGVEIVKSNSLIITKK